MKVGTLSHISFSAPRVLLWFIGTLYFKLLLFDLIWAIPTTFSAFQFPLGWLLKMVFCSFLALPLLFIKRKWYIYTVCFIVDIWLICNLMYFRNYYTVIPLSSYLLAGNLADFKSSVYEAVRFADVLFPLSTLFLIWLLRKVNLRQLLQRGCARLWRVLGYTGLMPAVLSGGLIIWKGGYKESYEKVLYDYSMVIPSVYTIPGTWVYSAIASQQELTPAIENKIKKWLSEQPLNDPDIAISRDSLPDNCIIILCESLESWPIGQTVDGKELTPRLNRLMREPHTFYGPRVLTQVKDARSIDAQLFIHAGLMPVSYGAYSYRFPHHEYMTLDKAWKQKHPGGKSYSFTVDKNTVWNAAIVAQDFGYDRLFDKREWTLDQATGPRHRLGDESFLKQSYEKIKGDDIFPRDGHTLLQCVTYSGHTPFIIPEEIKGIRFPDTSPYPERLRRYMETVNYTDRAIGSFVDSLRSNPKFAKTMIVITGDHEGIGIDRGDYLKVPGVARFLSPQQFTPFIVLNSPVSGQYDGVMGQIDIYPTLLDLLGLDDYPWRGQGASVFSQGKLPFAVNPRLQKIGCDSVSENVLRHARDAYEIGDLIIATDYFKKAKSPI